MGWQEERSQYKLKYPVKWGEKEVSEIIFRVPTAQDISEMSQDMNMGVLLKMAGKCCMTEGGTTLIKNLHAQDAIGVAELMGNFLGDSQETGN